MATAPHFLRLFESITPELVHLYRYLGISDEDQARDLLYTKGPEEWCNERGNWIDGLPPETVAALDRAAGREDDDGDDDQWFGDMDWDGFTRAADTAPEFAKGYAADLYDRMADIYSDDPSMQPSYGFFSDPELLRNVWCVHFTNDASGIMRKGFTVGMDDVSRLGLTTYYRNDGFDKKHGGYNFAYTADDVDRYSAGRYGGNKYGNSAVIFRTSCVRAWHSGDEEPQAIFWGKAVRPADILSVDKGENKEWALKGGHHEDGTGIVEKDTIGELCRWVDANWAQYRRALGVR